MSIHLLTRRLARERILPFVHAAFFFLLLMLPLQKKFKIFKGLSSSWTASFNFPEAFQKNIYFYATDLSLFALLLLFFSTLNWRAFFSNSSKYLTLLFFTALLSLTLSSTCVLHYVKLGHVFLLLLFFCALESGALFKRIGEWFPKICLVILAISIFECIVGILQYALQSKLGLGFLGETNNNCWVPFFNSSLSFFGGVSHDMMRRASGTFPHPNVFGGFMVLAIACSYFLFTWVKTRLGKILLRVALALQILTLCLTFSRAALIAWFLMTLCWCIFSQRMKLPWRAFAFSIGACLLACILIFYPALKARGGVVGYNKIVKDSDRERVQFQKIAMRMISEKPLLGVGFNQYVVRMQEFSPTPLKGDQFFPVHNIYLLVGAEMGILGLLLFLIFIGSIILRALKNALNPATASLLSLLVGLLFIGGCDFYLLGSQHGKLIFFTVLGLLSLLTRESKLTVGLISTMERKDVAR